MTHIGQDSLKTKANVKVGAKTYRYYSIKKAEKALGADFSRLPFSLKVLLENMLRHEDGVTVKLQDIKAFATWLKKKSNPREIQYRPARVLMQDFTGVPGVVDLASMRDAMAAKGLDPKKINPLNPVDLVIDHSVMIDHFGSADAFKKNVAMEYGRNAERYNFLRWGAQAFNNFRVVPPGTGICHQVNLEYLAQTVWSAKAKDEKGKRIDVAYPDTLVGTDSHTTMVNGLAVLGWGVGGIEAEAAMLGQPISMLIPDVVGFKLTGKMAEGITATDLVLTVTEMLRQKGVVGKFVEFYGPGLDQLSLADRATIANMAPEYGATCGFFPIDEETCAYMARTGRSPARVALVEKYAKAQGLWRTKRTPDPIFTDTLELDVATVVPSLAGPKRPQDRVALPDVPANFLGALANEYGKGDEITKRVKVRGQGHDLGHGDVVIAAITSCTNTSNPSVMVAAGLVARNATKLGLKVKPWVKTSLAPGSQVVTDYLTAAGLQKDLNKLGFNLVGYGCTTCIGNSGPLPPPIAKTIVDNDLAVSSVLSGNRNFEGRVNQHVRANYLASPPLVVAYAIAGSTQIDITKDPLGEDKKGNPVYLKDIWPTNAQITEVVSKSVTKAAFKKRYADVFKGDAGWRKIKAPEGMTYNFDPKSTYVQNPPFFTNDDQIGFRDVEEARILALLGDSITTDHISPAGSIKEDSPAGRYLKANKVKPLDFNSYGSRRGNHEVMMRGTFANIRIKNEMVPGIEGGVTTLMLPNAKGGKQMDIYDAAMEYQKRGIPLVVIGGKEYGTGSSRDWAAKGTNLLGVKAVITESYERIHRSNLVGMGVLPLQFPKGVTRKTLKLDGSETISLSGLNGKVKPGQNVTMTLTRKNGKQQKVSLLLRIDTVNEIAYYEAGGILQYVMAGLAKS